MRVLGRLLRGGLAAIAAVAIAWAFLRVGVREVARLRAGAEEGIVLRVMHWSGGGGQQEDAIVADAIASFEAANPGLRVERLNPGDSAQFFTKLQTMMASGSAPDVFYMDFQRLPAFVRAGQLAPVEPMIEADLAAGAADALRVEDFFAPAVDAFRSDGDRTGVGPLYGLPKDFTTLGFYYNRDLFRRAGLPEPASDWTWEEFIATARAIGAMEGCTGAEFVTWPFVLRGYLRTEGTDLRGEGWDAPLTATDPTLLAALERLRGWRGEGTRALAPAEAAGIDPASRFLSGDLGMVGPVGRWVVPMFRAIPEPEAGGFDWDFAPMPRGAARSNVVATVAWSAWSGSPHPEEAWRLVKYLAGAEAQARLARLGLAIPTLRDVAESDAFVDPALRPSRDRDFLDAAEVARVVDWPADPRLEDAFRRATDLVLRTGAPAEETMATLAEWWERERSGPLARGGHPPMRWGLVGAVSALLVALGVAAVAVVRRRRPLSRRAASEERAGYLFAGPWLVGFALLLAFPIALSFLLSLCRWSGLGPLGTAEFVGLANYRQILFADATFRKSLAVTAIYALLAVPSGQVLALAAALLLNVKLRGVELFRAAWYLPSVLAGVGIAVLWQWVFRGEGGLMNAALAPLLAPLGLEPPDWFNADAARFGVPAFAIMNLWMTGGSMMIYLAGLRNVPRELHEAAEIDRVGPVGRFFAVTLPMLGPVILFNGIMAIIGSFQVFTQAFVMTSGGPGDHTRFYVLYLYNLAFDFYRMGYASALAWLLLVVVLALTAIVLRGSRGFVHYEALRS